MRKSTDREFLEYLHARMLRKIVNKKEFTNWLRSEWKHNSKLTSEQSEYAYDVYTKFFDCIDDNNVNLDY